MCLTITAIALHYYTISGSLFERMNLTLFDFFFAICTTFTTNQIVGKRSPPMVKINKDFLFSSFFTWPRELYQNPSSRYILLPVLRTFRDAGTTREKKKFLVYLSDQPLIGRFSTEIFRHFFQIVSTDGAIGKKYTFIHDIEYLQHVIRSVRHVCANRFI